MALSTFLRTYYVTAQIDGPSGGGPSGSNKAMLSLLNPSSSGKTIHLLALEYYPMSSSGTNLMLDIQLRSITAHSGGTSLTPVKRESSDDDAYGAVMSEPSSLTGGDAADQISQHSLQSNTVQSASSHIWRFGTLLGEKPIILAEGEGVVVHQVTSNGGTNAIGLLWTES